MTDVLLVRSTSRIGEDIVAGSQLRFVGSVTIGTDHIDVDTLTRHGIAFAHAPGSNATSVVEYVLATLLLVASRQGERLAGKTLGIVGCGNVGGRLAQRAHALGLYVLKCDPALAQKATPEYVTLDTILEAADIVSIHVPLTRSGPYPTHHMLDARRLGSLKAGAWLVNTSRGAVIDSRALLACLRRGHIGVAIMDVWEQEPSPDPELVGESTVATPHIAGHSFDGKLRGTIMLHEAIVRHFGIQSAWDASALLAPAPGDRLEIAPPRLAKSDTDWLHGVVRQMYDVSTDDARMRRLAALSAEKRADTFGRLRRAYARRRSFNLHYIHSARVPLGLRDALQHGLQMQLR